ncbi:MAG: LamG domain-containing protein, partial [bacterium]|nr:LamG domain-containing protein [bacterium]
AELRIWRLARTAEEILAGMHQRLTGDEPDLAACWPLDDGTGELAANRRTTLPGADHGATPATLVRTLPDGGAATPPPRLRLDGTGRVDMPRHEDLELTQYTFETWFHPDALPGAEGAVLAGRRRTSVMDFDGTDDYFAVRDLHYQGAIDGATVEAWVRTTKTSQGIIASWDRSEYWRLAVCTDVASLAQDRVFWATTHDHIDDMVGSTVVNDGTWHHVAATYDPASGAKKIYVDGALDAENTTSGGLPFGTSTTRYGFIGVGSEAETFDGTTSPNDFFQGQMAELRIWDHARSEAELQQDMNRRLLGNESGLVAYWPLDTLTGGETPDETANSYAGVGRGDPALSTADPPPIHDAGLDLLMLTDGALRHRCLTDTGVTGPADTAAGSIAPGRWSHVAASNDGTTARTLIDGEVASEAPVTGLVAQGGGLRLGEGFAGLVAEVRLWNEALTAEEIAAGKSLRTTGDEEHLAGDWPLDEASGSVVLNRVSGGPDGTLTGGERVALLDTPFPGQQALELDGTAAYVEIPHAPEIHFAAADESFTVELWMRAAEGTAGDERVLVEKWSGIGSYPFALRYRPATGEIVFARSTGDASSSPILVSQPGCGDGVWHHVAAVKEGATLRLFVDGALAAETTDPIVDRIRGTSPVYAGSRGGTSHFFHGAITELRIWRRARTAEELASGRWPRLSGEEAGLAGYWPLNAVVDAEVADGLAHLAGALSGGTWADGEDLPLLTGAGETAPTAAFDGLTSTVTVAADPILMPASAITVEAWVRPQAAGGQAFLGPVASCGDAVSGWGLRATGTDCGFLITLDGVQHHVRWPSTAGACRWVHLAGIYDGAALTLYANGVAVAVQAVAGAITPYAGNLVIGGHPYWTSRHFQGQIAEVRVWSTARNAQQIRANLFRRLTGEEPWLAGYWPLADGEGTLAASGGGSAGNGSTDSVAWVAAELPPRVAPAPTPAPDSPDRIAGLERRLGELEAELAEV